MGNEEMIRQLWWVPLVLAYYFAYGWFSWKNNTVGRRWMAAMFVFGALCPLWLLVSRHSKNLVRDGLLYDSLMLLGYNLMLVHLGIAAGFGMRQWAGVGLMVAGFYLLR